MIAYNVNTIIRMMKNVFEGMPGMYVIGWVSYCLLAVNYLIISFQKVMKIKSRSNFFFVLKK